MDIIETVLSFLHIPIYIPSSSEPQPLPPKQDPAAFSGGIGDPRPSFPNVFTSEVGPHVVGGATDSDAIAPIAAQVADVAKKLGAPAIAAGGAAIAAGSSSAAVASAAV